MRTRSLSPERGSMAPLAVAAVFVLIAALSFAVDQGIAYAAKARQENALDSARSACMDASFALAAKNAQDPGRQIAETVVRAVRAQGFLGRTTVWFYEAASQEVPKAERLWAVGVQLEEEAETVFARGFGLEGIPVASHKVIVARPYASEVAWRPQERLCGRYEVEAGQAAASASFAQLDSAGEFPAEMADAIREALADGEGQ